MSKTAGLVPREGGGGGLQRAQRGHGEGSQGRRRDLVVLDSPWELLEGLFSGGLWPHSSLGSFQGTTVI